MISAVLACLLVLVAGPAAALGLGQIRVLSQADEPLLAEIPIISNDPAELEQLQARLAPPETFRRIGLDPPQGVVAELRFAVALDARGRPVVRVTSSELIRQPMLNFLVEVDWGRGRLVREYSALIETPDAVAAPLQPAIQAPVAAPDNSITRLPQTPVTETTPPLEATGQPEPSAQTTPTPTPMPETAPAPAPAWQTTAPIVTTAPAPSGDYRVRRGDTLSGIAAALQLAGGYSLDQTMLALLHSNPEAFIDGNVNLVKAGAVLRMPEQAELARLDRAEASALVRAQTRRWREAQQPAPQPVVADVAAVAGDDSAATAAAQGEGVGGRLEIVPPTGGETPGTQSGVSAGGEGDMLRTQVLQEELASRNAEVQELRARVAELEQLQDKQQQLIELKDSELASVEQQLASARTSSGQDEAATATVTEQTTSPAQENPWLTSTPWLIGGGVLLVLAALVWWLARRGRHAPTESKTAGGSGRRGYDSEAMASGLFAVRESGQPDAHDQQEAPESSEPTEPDNDAPENAAETDTDTAPASPQDDARADTAPTWHDNAASAEEGHTEEAQDRGDSPARDRIALARAYIDLGDDDAARDLLREALTADNPAERAEATKLLRELD